jgi:predicted outer membrane protein
MRKLFGLTAVVLLAATVAQTAASRPRAMPGMKMAPAHLIVGGKYSDVRFVDMTVPHHLMAIQMAQVEVRLGSKASLKAMARKMIADQKKEIAELKAIKKRLTGVSATPTMMSMHQMQETGMPMPSEIAKARPVDLAFIDAMVPHHSSLIPMANVVLRRSSDTELQALARKMLDAQAKQVGQMIKLREAWFKGTVEPPQP